MSELHELITRLGQFLFLPDWSSGRWRKKTKILSFLKGLMTREDLEFFDFLIIRLSLEKSNQSVAILVVSSKIITLRKKYV